MNVFSKNTLEFVYKADLIKNSNIKLIYFFEKPSKLGFFSKKSSIQYTL